jgi:hypothetical protein
MRLHLTATLATHQGMWPMRSQDNPRRFGPRQHTLTSSATRLLVLRHALALLRCILVQKSSSVKRLVVQAACHGCNSCPTDTFQQQIAKARACYIACSMFQVTGRESVDRHRSFQPLESNFTDQTPPTRHTAGHLKQAHRRRSFRQLHRRFTNTRLGYAAHQLPCCRVTWLPACVWLKHDRTHH